MLYKDVVEVIPLRDFILVEETEESKNVVEKGIRESDSYLKKCPIVEIVKKGKDVVSEVEEGDFGLYKKLTEQTTFLLGKGENRRELVIINENSLIAKLK